MAQTSCVVALGLALAALCLLALPQDARARPGELRTGVRQELSPDDPQVQRATQVAVATYNMHSNSVYYFRDTHILKAQSQLVAGIKYYLTVEMGSTACCKTAVTGDRSVDLTTCPLATGAQQEKLHCDFEMLMVPWQNTSQLLNHNCVPLY
ncbi:cystatin-M [Elephas maximus indicus]|uniref:cystatin-M n=1 Tax=Elephas maximus indicus TaxID=99487 RepID=UPI0021162957|nr:cystatin-M [Elephas maximus indicus]